MSAKSSSAINYETLLKRILQVRPAASIEDICRLAPQLNALHFNDLAARVSRIRKKMNPNPPKDTDDGMRPF